MRNVVRDLWNNKNHRYAVIIAGLVVLWLLSGLLFGQDDSADNDTPAAEAQEQPLPQVRARSSEAQPYMLRVRSKGRTQADRVVDLQAEVTGQVEEIVVEQGQQVVAGDVICRLAMEDRELRLKEAQAALEQAQIDYDGAQRLASDGLQSRVNIANAKARLETTRAVLKRREIEVEKTTMRAPFDGMVDRQHAEVGSYMRPGDSCATVLDLDPLVVTAEVSEMDVVKLKEGGDAWARLITGDKVKGRIRYIAREGNENTRTFAVEVAIANPQMNYFSGLTTELLFETQQVRAHLVPASVLTLDDAGKVGLRVLDQNHRVEFYTVTPVGDDAEGVWVTGLPDTTLVITVGQEYVGAGQQVAATIEDSGTETTSSLSAEL